MPKKLSLEDEINLFLETWDHKQMRAFFYDILPLIELYNVDIDDDWVAHEVGGDEENIRTVRLIRTVYLISKIAEYHSGRLCEIKIKFKNLFKKMEKLDV